MAFYAKMKKGKRVYNMKHDTYNPNVYSLLNKITISPDNLDERDIEDIIQYSTSLDYLGLANLIKTLNHVPDHTWYKINHDPRFQTHLTTLVLEDQLIATAQHWGKRPGGIN